MRRAIWIDAFTEDRYGGNPCVVVFDADDLSADDRIAFTRETGLVECAFLVASEKADFGARYYMPTGEIPLAGHPTVATVTALAHAGLVAPPARFTLEVGGGVMEIDLARAPSGAPLVTMTQPAPVFGRIYDPGAIAAIYGLGAGDVIGAPQTVTIGGTAFCVTRLTSPAALAAARLDPDALATFKTAEDADFMEPFLCVTTERAEGAATATATATATAARLLLPPPFPPEDPFTGSATGCMAAALFREGAVARRFTATQGDGMGRPGRAAVEVVGPAAAPTGVKVGGAGVVVMDGGIAD